MGRVTRRGAAVSALGIAVPIGALAVAWSADRALHHHADAAPLPAREAVVERPTPQPSRAETLDDLLRRYGRVCAGPDGIDECTPFAFDYMLAGKFRELGVTRADLERRWRSDYSDPVAPFGLAWLEGAQAVPALRDRLLAERSSRLWSGRTPRDAWVLFADDQFPREKALIALIERLSHRPVRDVVALTNSERIDLYRDAESCSGWRAATWLLHALDGAPLPSRGQTRTKRFTCDGSW